MQFTHTLRPKFSLKSAASLYETMLNREWKFKAVGSNSFTVSQFNVLADGLAQTGNFVACPADDLEWEPRSRLCRAEIERMKPDLLCMQEVNKPETFAGLLPGHSMLYCPKLASPAQACGALPDGTAMFINREVFHIIDAQIFYYANSHDIDKPKNQGGIVVGVKDKRTGEGMVLATTHLKSKDKVEFEAIRHDQVTQLLQKVDGMKSMVSGYTNSRKVTVILTGDFNSPPHDSCYALMRQRNYHSVYNDNFAKAFYEKKDVPVQEYLQGEPAFTTMKIRESLVSRTIDYIWIQSWEQKVDSVLESIVADSSETAEENKSSRPSLNVICEALYSMPTEEEVGAAGLPSKLYPSDHLAIGATLAWKEEEKE